MASSKEIIYSIQWVSALVFGYLAYLLYEQEKSYFYEGNRKSALRFWLIMQFFSEAVGQIFIGLSARESVAPKYKYFEWNNYGHIAWVNKL
jgi:hypothetical protein